MLVSVISYSDNISKGIFFILPSPGTSQPWGKPIHALVPVVDVFVDDNTASTTNFEWWHIIIMSQSCNISGICIFTTSVVGMLKEFGSTSSASSHQNVWKKSGWRVSSFCLFWYNSAISSFTLQNITPLITLAIQYKFYDGGQIITQLERDNLSSLWSIILMLTCPSWRES